MNPDCTKPFVAPKPRLVCHASLKLPSPHMSRARGPAPSVAPKPKVTPELNGNPRCCINGDSFISDVEADKAASGLSTAAAAKNQASTCILGSLREDAQSVLCRAEFRDVTEEEKEEEEEEELFQQMDEDWKGRDGAQRTEETNSLETLWVSELGLTADSEDAVEMVDTDVTEDMDAEGCDAGEALADPEGLSVGDVNELPGCFSAGGAHNQVREGGETGDCTADDLTESLSDEPRVLHNSMDRVEASCHPGVSKAPKFSSKTKGKCKNLQNVSFYNQKPTRADDNPTREPFYVSSADIINGEMMPKSNLALQSPLAGRRRLSLSGSEASLEHFEEAAEPGPASADYVGIANNGYGCQGRKANKGRTYQKWLRKELRAPAAKEPLNRSDQQPGLRLVSVSLAADSDASLTSSFSDSTLLSPDDSELSDFEGHVVPFLDSDTTDTERDISEDHVYEAPGQSSASKNIFPYDATGSARFHPDLLPLRLREGLQEGGAAALLTRSFQPALSSSPMLNSKQKTRTKPLYLSQYPRSISVEGQNSSSGVYSYMEGSPRLGGAICSSGSFSRCSPMSSSGLSTPTSVVDIPPPFELAYITKKPITKSSPSIFTEGDFPEKNRKSKSSLKRFLMLKFRGKLTDSKSDTDVNPSLFKPSVESRDSNPTAGSCSPRLNLRGGSQGSPEPVSKFLYYKDFKSSEISTAFLTRSVVRVESFEDRSRVPFMPLPLTKPRSISFPNTNSSDYENVPAISSDYENLQVPQRRPVRQVPFTNFFDRPSRVLSSANETDGYVDMSSLPGFKMKSQPPDQETESAYTEAYNVCLVAAAAAAAKQPALLCDAGGETTAEEDQGRTSEEEEGGADGAYQRQDGRSRAFYVAKELMDTERRHVKALKLLQEDFREAVGAAVGDEGEPVLEEERLREILNELPDVYTLHRRILNELENRLRHWEESQRIADIFLSRSAEFLAFTTYIGHYDRSMTLLEESCRTSPAFAAIVHQFEQQSPPGEDVSLKHQLLKVVVRVAQYRMLLTDYLNNLSPDSKEYEDTQAALAFISDIADQANDSLRHGENLLRLVNIEYSVRGQQDLLQPGRVFVKEGTLMKVSRKSRQPRHLFLMNDVLLYTYPQQDGKYRLKNTLSLTGLKVSKPAVENVQYALRIEGDDLTITLSASSFIEREDWFYAIARTVTEHSRGTQAAGTSKENPRDHLGLSIGETAPALVPVSQVMMCMNCTSDFSLTLRRHHCHGCGRIVCRSCCRNRYPLKYMKDRMAKVCDHCYSELKKRGNVSTLSGQSSPRPHRSTRPLSAVFQNIHPPNIWRHRKGTLSFTQVTVSEEGSISGTLQRTKKSKRSWKRLWFLLKDKVLYTYRAQEEKVASESLPLLGFTVKLPGTPEGVEDETNIFQLYHKNTLYYTFKARDNHTAQRWVDAMEEATVL